MTWLGEIMKRLGHLARCCRMTMTEAPPTAEQIAIRAQELKILHLALMMSIGPIMDPALPVLRNELRRAQVDEAGDLPVNLYYQEAASEKECLSFSARGIFTAATHLQGDVVKYDVMAMSMLHAGIRLGDMLNKGGHIREDVPLLQFAYHFRNACGHGDVWNYSPKGTPHPATCRNLTLTPDLVGRRATWETVTPRLFVEFLDDISNHLVPGTVPEPLRGS